MAQSLPQDVQKNLAAKQFALGQTFRVGLFCFWNTYTTALAPETRRATFPDLTTVGENAWAL